MDDFIHTAAVVCPNPDCAARNRVHSGREPEALCGRCHAALFPGPAAVSASGLQLTPDTAVLLQKAGWSENRWVDPTDAAAALRAAGYPVYPIVFDFLGRFGELSCKGCDTFHFDAKRAMASEFFENIRGVGNVVGVPVCPIGQCSGGSMILLMDPEGAIYADYSGYLAFVGPSVSDCLNSLAGSKMPWPDVPYEGWQKPLSASPGHE